MADEEQTMSTPFESESLRGCIVEMIDAISSLNMLPDPIEPADREIPADHHAFEWLSQSDENVKHAINHIRFAVKSLNDIRIQIDRAVLAIEIVTPPNSKVEEVISRIRKMI